MSGRFQPYDIYQDSGVLHLQKVPQKWEIKQLKRSVVGCINGIWGDESNGGEEDISVIRIADFDRPRLRIKGVEYTKRAISEKERERRLLSFGDLLIEKSGGGEKTQVGQVVLFEGEFAAVCSNFVARMTPLEGYSSSYLNYSFSSLYRDGINSRSIKQNTGIQNLDSDSYLSEYWAFPSFKEQTQIAKFLDYETAKIDALIEKQEQLITLLKEKRQAVISHAVTKGLNPDVPMCDSGIEWLREIPAHWTLKRLKHISPKVGVGLVINPSTYTTDEGVYFLFGGDVNEYSFNLTNARRMSLEDSDRLTPSRLQAGDLVSVRVGSPGVTAVVPPELEGANCASIIILRKGDFYSEWLCYAMNSWVGRHQVGLVAYGAAQKQFNVSDAVEFKFPFPPREEQRAISESITDSVKCYDSLSDRAVGAVGLLRERRVAIISAAVTGKIDVRDWKPPESELKTEAA